MCSNRRKPLPKLSVDLDTIKRLARFAAKRSAEDRIPQVAGRLSLDYLLGDRAPRS